MSSTDNPLKIIPVNFGVKFHPPKLGLEYHMPNQPQIPLTYEIPLQNLLSKQLSVEQIVDQIFELHSYYVHPRVISRKQVTNLIERVLAR